ncbi:HDOD domain-containing protein [Geomonas sp. RF6]|uniref:HDOD domain-containing protein n=1 Tax=Geomonas sp. RF6 TaxID=2897342 RepID=UPI001E61CF2D|nr:HDOD domain-containing protein [Geomonas sp. RF6]UFS72632.1 HDOD domain-containing protein [Geomonas sp. RF6]
MTTKPFVELIKEQMDVEGLQLPMFHAVAVKLQEVLSSDDFTIEQVAALIIKDQALTSQILRLANSAFFSGLSKVTTITEAVVRLGAREIASIAMMATQQNTYNSLTIPELRSYSQLLWRHAIGCAIGSRWLAERTGFKHLSQEAFIAGLLHDIGCLLILKVLEALLLSGETELKFSRELAAEIMETMHTDCGYDLMQKWNLPDLYSVIVRDHHKEQSDTNNVLLSIVHLVNTTCRKLGLSTSPDTSVMVAATFEAQNMGIKEITLAELEITIEDAMELAVAAP